MAAFHDFGHAEALFDTGQTIRVYAFYGEAGIFHGLCPKIAASAIGVLINRHRPGCLAPGRTSHQEARIVAWLPQLFFVAMTLLRSFPYR